MDRAEGGEEGRGEEESKDLDDFKKRVYLRKSRKSEAS